MTRSETMGRAKIRMISLLCVTMIALTATTGWAAWTHGISEGYDVWRWDGALKFEYNLTTRQWWDYSSVNSTWYVLTTTGSSGAFIGDGGWRNLGNGFVYSYNVTNDMAWFKNGTDGRFGYYYAPGRWVNSGNTGSWQYLGSAGLSASFIGDSAWHDLSNGFTYAYSAASDLGWFKRTTGGGRFGYYYAPSRWITTGNYGGWQYAGNAGLSASFLGDGAWHSLGNGFNYSYVAASDLGWFKTGNAGRFGYYYAPSRWITTGNYGGWQSTGNAGLSASFLGDGSGHALGNGFTLRYTAGSADYGTFTLTTGGSNRFRYGYTTGQWEHYGADLAWANLGNGALSASFMGDGSAHGLGTGWWFTYNPGSGATDDQGRFSLSASAHNRFAYGYDGGQWFHYGSSWVGLGGTGASLASFMGDGSSHDLGTGWWFTYNAGTGYGDDQGQWGRDATTGKYRFAYGYNAGQWNHYDAYATTAGWTSLGGASQALASFIGDGSDHDLGTWNGNPWHFTYDYSLDYGQFSRTGLDRRFAYGYNGGQWYHYDAYATTPAWMGLGGASQSSALFIGDGSDHDLGTWYGNPWHFTYDYALDYGQFSRVGLGWRFAYKYNGGQWFHYDAYAATPGWTSLGGTSQTLASFIGDGESHVLDASWTYSYSASGDCGYFDLLVGGRFYYSYGPGKWYHKGNTTAWAALTADNYSAAFIGDGGSYDLGNGFSYSYLNNSDRGVFTHGFNERFYYGYSPSQWLHKGDTTAWAAFSAGGVSAQFVGDGGWYDLGNGFSYSYSSSSSNGYFKVGGFERFYYDYAPGQWYHKGNATDWVALTAGNYSAAFVGDGKAHYLDNGVSYYYTTSSDNGWFKIGGHERFWYEYTPGRWRHHRGGTGTWQDLGNAGISALFVGDGGWHDLGNGWSYSYLNSSDYGYFKAGATERFSYRYGPGQWYHKGDTTAWAALTAGNYSLAFIGDGGWYDLGNGWSYSYLKTSDRGYFKAGGANRFYYTYGPSQWYHKGDTTAWDTLSAAGVSALFVGDGGWHDLGNGLHYQYVIADGEGSFKVGTAERFSYSYGPSQWFHKGNASAWAALTADNYSSAFIGDGGWHDVGNGWSYSYLSTSDYGYFKAGAAERFYYTYGPSQWYHKGDTTAWAALSAAGLSALFVGDGADHDLGNGFTYQYLIANEEGYFKAGAAERFCYTYGPSQWFHQGDTTGWVALTAGEYSAQFVGDGEWYDLGNGLTYQYVTADGKGYFKVGAAERFAYSYGPSQWFHRGDPASWAALTAGGYSAAFIGDGAWHDLGNGWSYTYLSASDGGYFKTGDSERFSYAYGPGRWYHKGDTTDWRALTAENYSLAFIGDAADHVLDDSWTYSYSESSDCGYFKLSAGERFFYHYEPGQWFHKGDTRDWAALTDGEYSAQFVGDGGWFDLGNGFSYYYNIFSDLAYFSLDGGDVDRFMYFYGDEQWLHIGNCGNSWWANLTGEQYSAAFIGDGGWYDLGNGWSYSYLSASDYGIFKAGDTQRFAYGYSPSQWLHKGDTTAWAAFSAGGVSAQFVGDGGSYDLGNGFTYQYVPVDGKGSFKVGSAERFFFIYVTSQWFHKGNTSDWAALTPVSYSARFVGDGAEHDLGNGFSYYYTTSSDNGWFKAGGHERFWYKYAAGQWLHSRAGSGSWYNLSAAGVSAVFVGDGAWHDLGTGWSYSYLSASDDGYFKAGALERFYYSYGPGQWFHTGDSTAWGALSAVGVSAGFVGDGAQHDLGNGFSYTYSSTSDRGYFHEGAADRFYYAYGAEQWLHRGNHSDWVALTAGGYSAQFVGDGGWHDLGNEWWYSYLNTSDYGYFKIGAAERFAYSYGPSQWDHKGETTAWAVLTSGNYSAQFVGDGGWHDLGNEWWYSYLMAVDTGNFKIGPVERFSYAYGASQWYHKGDTTDWAALSAAGLSAQFVGNGGWYDLGTGFTYRYLIAVDTGHFRVGTTDQRFYYAYGPEQWFHRGNTTDWVALTAGSYSAEFIGDGGTHDLDNGFDYWYSAGDNSGYFKEGDTPRFDYWYNGSQWFVRDDQSDWAWLSAEGASAQFIGDGEWHDMGTGWWYHYVLSISTGYWGKGDPPSDWTNQRFNYNYTTGSWEHKGYYGEFHDLGPEGWWDPSFLGDGANHRVPGNASPFYYTYRFDYSLDHGYWNQNSPTHLPHNYKYYYDTGDWYEHYWGYWHHPSGPGASTGDGNPY